MYATCPVLTWESATAAEIHSPQSIEYEIFIDTSAGFDNPTVLLTRGKTTTVQVCDLAPDRIYYWKVKAENIVGASQWSSQVYSFVLAPEDQQHVTLKDFSLITPGFNAIVNTTHPTVYWESAARDIIKSPDDIVYRVLYSSSPNFEMSQSITIDGDVSWVELPRLQPGTICFWKVIARNKAGMEKTSLNYSALAIGDHTTGGEKEQHDLDNFVLFQNYPNPFNPWTTIRFNLAEDSEAVVTVYDIAGYAVRKLLREYKGAGEHAVVWDGIDDQGNKLCSGVYIYRLQFLDSQGNIRVSDKKMMLLK
ncbi:T9SS type A sorting domain-containing protein [candidate division KSB1 bacterium]|nr:T9SS type A sorting domain-containing protein [candidate division KSB1 bacterium]RQW11000.1 MAG: T9SS C-terminal target domain-containing protein [candidate division KSB1 bacterium]